MAAPCEIPLTTPSALTVAMLVAVELHTPPVTASVNAVVEPAQTILDPVMLPAEGVALTVTTLVVDVVPQLLVTI